GVLMNMSINNTTQASNQAGMASANLRVGTSSAPAKYFAIGTCSLGSILVARGEHGVCAIFLGDDPALLVRDLQGRFLRANLMQGDAECEQLLAKVAAFID